MICVDIAKCQALAGRMKSVGGPHAARGRGLDSTALGSYRHVKNHACILNKCIHGWLLLKHITLLISLCLDGYLKAKSRLLELNSAADYIVLTPEGENFLQLQFIIY